MLDEKASRRHASIHFEGDEFVLTDEGSSNGTGLNGALLIEPRRLEPGDEIAIGNNLLLFDPDLEILRGLDGSGAVILAPSMGEKLPARLLAAAGARAPSFRVEALLAEIAQMLAGPRGIGRPAALVEAMVRGLSADRGALLVAPVGGEPMKAVATFPHRARVTVNRELVDQVLLDRQTTLVDQGVGELTMYGGRSLIEARSGIALVVPVLLGGGVRGVFYADSVVSDGFRGLPLETLKALVSMAFAPLLTGDPKQLRPAMDERMEVHPIARSEASLQILEQVHAVADGVGPVLISGEAGSGKSFIAQHLHKLSARAAGPFRVTRCSALADGAADTLVFGRSGGADTRFIGLVESCDGGTVLLDEIGDLPRALQVKLLRLLQEGRFYRAGGTRPIRTDVRILVGCRRNLPRLVEEGTFLADLYDRLSATELALPALSDRLADIQPLVREFTREFNARTGASMAGFTPEAVELLETAAWPGNLRELKSVVDRLLVCAPGATVEELEVRQELGILPWAAAMDPTRSPRKDIAVLERKVAGRALARTRGSRARAAGLLGVTRLELDRRIAQYKVDPRAI